MFPPSAQRLATFLQRKHGVWVASPSMAVFSALVAGKGRPKRLLMQGDEPSFISNIGRIAGAMPLKAPLSDLDQVLDGVLKTEVLSPDHVWGIVTHRDGGVAPSEWLARLGARGIPTIERCSGSLFALASQGGSLATFTIVELDAEESLNGTHLTALLTSDPAMAERVLELCLPDPDATDYVFDASPRGLVQDEPALADLIERALAQGGRKTPEPGATPLFGLSWTRRFRSKEDEASPGATDDAPVPTGQNPWLVRLAAAETRHEDALRIASESSSAFQPRLDQLQSVAEQWQRRCEAAERLLRSPNEEGSLDRSDEHEKVRHLQASLEEAQSELRTERGARGEIETLRTSLAEREHELTESKALLAKQVHQEAELSAAWEASRSSLLEQLAGMKAETIGFEKVRADLLAQRAEAEAELSSSLAESTSLAKALARVERERDLARAEAASREESVRAVDQGRRILAEKLDGAVSSAAERAARQAQEWEASRAELTARIVRLEADAVVFGKARADLVAQKSEAEHALALSRNDREALAKSLAEVKTDLLETLAEASKRDAAHRELLDGQCHRADKLQADLAALTVEAASRSEETLALRAQTTLTISRLEEEVAASRQAVEAVTRQKSQVETALQSIETESEALVDRLSQTEKERDGARADAAKLEWSHRNVVAGHTQRAERMEQELGLLKESQARQVAEWTASSAEQSAKIATLEARSVAAERAGARSLAAVADTERLLVVSRSEAAAAAEALAKAQQAHLIASSDVERLLQVQQTAIEEQRNRSERLEADGRALAEVKAREASEWAASRVEFSERIAGLVANLATAEGSAKEVATEKERTERALAAMQSQSEVLVGKLTEAEKSRELALAQAARLQEEHELDIAGHKQRAEGLEAETATLSQQVAALVSEAAQTEEARKDLLAQKARALSEAADFRAEKESLSEQLGQARQDHDLAAREGTKREQALQAELNEIKQLVELSEKNTAVLNVREARRAIEWERARVEMSARIGSLEASASAAQIEHERVVLEKAEFERALEASRTQTEAGSNRLAEAEQRFEQSLAEGTRREEAQRTEIAEAARREEAQRTEIAEAARREEAQRTEIAEAGRRADLSEKQAAALAERESLQAQTWGALRAELSERVTHFEAAAIAADKLHAGLLAQKSELQGILDAEREEKASLRLKIEEAERDHETAKAETEKRDAALRAELDERVDRETVLNREWEAARAGSGERISRLELAAVAAENANTDLENALATARSEREAVVHKLVEAKRERDLARAEAAKQDESYRVELDSQRQRAAKAEREAVVRGERAAAQAKEWETARAELAERIDHLESDATTAEVAHKKLLADKAQAERNAALARVESEGVLKKLAEAERERSMALAEGASLEAALLAAAEEQKKRAGRLEQESADRVERERLQAREWEAERTAFSDRIARLEAVASAAAAAAAASAHLEGEKSSVERDLALMREETEALRLKLVEVERQRDTALSAAERRLDAQLAVHEEQKGRLEQLEAQVTDGAAREKIFSRDLATLRNELIESKTQQDLAAVAAEEERKALLGQTEQADRSLAAVRSEREALVKRLVEVKGTRDLALLDAAKRDSAHKTALDEQMARAEQAEKDNAALLEREAKDRQAAEVLQAELSARINRLEANELIAEKARTELLTRKRETERALLVVQAEKDALVARLLDAERVRVPPASGRGVKQGATLRPEERPGIAGLLSPKADEASAQRETGPLSQLIDALSTGARRRPARKKLVVEADGPADPTPLSPEFADLEGLSRGPALTPPDAKVVRPSTGPEVEAPSPKAEENEAIARPAGWLQGLASRIRRGPKGPS